MMAPVVARHYAIHLTGGPAHPFFEAWRPDRFSPGGRGGAGAAREEMIIG
jgi:hypothetical protein